jgi:branched-chain amino acid transport system substrate-binding protein
LAALIALGGCGQESGPVLIGLTGPLSEPRGRSMRLAAELAVREINAAGGVRGRPLELVLEDDSAQSARAIQVAQSFMDNPRVLAVVGHMTSGPAIAAASIYNSPPEPLVALTPSASNPDLTAAGDRYTFRLCATDLQHGPALARYAYGRLGARTAVVLYQNDDYGRGILSTFTAEFRRLGGRIDETDPYLSSETDVRAYLERIQRRARADVMMIAGDRASAVAILRRSRQRGLNLPVLGGDALSGIQAEGALSEGVLFSSNWLPDRPGEKNAVFLRDYAAAYDNELPDHRGAGAYDAVYLIARAIRERGARRDAIRDALAALREAGGFEGVTGRIAFDERGDVPDKDVDVAVVRGGRLVRAEQ